MMRIALLIACVAAVEVSAANWLQFRGPHGASVSEESGLPTRLDPEGSVCWKAPLPGRGLSSPIIVGDRIYLTACSGARQERLHVICLNARDGSRRWERQFWATGRTGCHEKISVAAPTPVSDGSHIFALFSSNDLVCLDLDGQLVWLRGLMRDYPNASNNLGLSSSPVVENGILVVQAEGDGDAFAAGIDVATGLNRWKVERPRRVNWTSPIVARGMDGKAMVLLQSGEGLHALALETGRALWSRAGGADTIPSLTMADGKLFVPSRGLTALQLGAAETAPSALWQSNLLKPSTPSPVAFGGKLFVVNDAGVLTCGDVATGKRVWQLRLKGPITATPVAAGGHLYAVNETGLVQVVDPKEPEGEIVSELALGETILSTPSIGAGGIYFRSDGHVWKIGFRGR